ncbi:RHS repeat-associated core domain-containing protein [Pseudomonas sp. p50]|uniref:RHS repeat-associated core domain-containing protein n=1 Tax=Pseudomonas sp. p50(2008) TaxID=2816832 RepID=UPI00188B64C5|nr:RHS repeat-associated core domain-containing protein [Pseudomonas sp. p50(2008)]MBF4556067.1 RHS repeat-associated core domain-containing protein [Pseudomonas sp. p50(2008)]
MQTYSKTLLCRYHYDPLDRLVDCTLSGQENLRRFYQNNRLATEINDTLKRSIMQHEDQLLAQQQRKTHSVETSLMATDQQRSVLNVLDTSATRSIAYTPYGHRPLASGLLSLLGFNGERPDPVTGHYLLGNGHRAFNPVLMRFNSPDSWSPFGKGGLNAYAYCVGDPVNRRDPRGHSWTLVRSNLNKIANMSKPAQPSNIIHVPRTGYLKNIHRIGEGAISFEDMYKGKKRLNFLAHGNKPSPNRSSGLKVNGKLWSAEYFYSAAKAQGIDFEQFDNVRVIACYSGSGGIHSFAANLSTLTKKQTKGYVGTIQTKVNTFNPVDQIEDYYKKFKSDADEFYNEDYPDISLTIHKHNPYDPIIEASDYFRYNFLSIRFQN